VLELVEHLHVFTKNRNEHAQQRQHPAGWHRAYR
jgi:hypothetical protein